MFRSCVDGLMVCWGALGLTMNAVDIMTSESPVVAVVAERFVFDLSSPGVGVVPSVVGKMS
eukprot:6275999-Alexandrium_andersonii.AAC.1